MTRRHGFRISCGLAVLLLAACGGSETTAPDEAPTSASAPAAEPGPATDPTPAVDPAPSDAGDEIDPDALAESGTIAIKEYSAAYIGSGTLGSGTLTYQGRQHPFSIGGLGIGGIGVAKIDAHGSVYNLDDLKSFEGTYGNARLGATAADKGKGRLWLKNPKGVVLKLWADIQGLALTGGVDGIIITLGSGVAEAMDDVEQGGNEAARETEKAWDSAKDAFE